jgi:antitoxin component YwqK of YwqJK toxin-antitoxin module
MGKKDGMERFWWPNGNLKEQGQWFDGKANGVFREWDEQGKPLKVVRYKNGQIIEVILEEG